MPPIALQVTSLAIAFIQAGLDLQRVERARAEAGRDGYTPEELAVFREAARSALNSVSKLMNPPAQ